MDRYAEIGQDIWIWRLRARLHHFVREDCRRGNFEICRVDEKELKAALFTIQHLRSISLGGEDSAIILCHCLLATVVNSYVASFMNPESRLSTKCEHEAIRTKIQPRIGFQNSSQTH